MSVIHYVTPAIADAAAQIHQASAQTETNHQRSLQTVAANADNFGGQGSEAFQHVIATLNQKYAQSQETIQRASVVLAQSNDGMTHADGTSAGQYSV
jgi:WXG100 family type VII secretion target